MRDYKAIKKEKNKGKKVLEKEIPLKDRVTKRINKRIAVLKHEMWDYRTQLEKGTLC